jgi:NADH:ubiquinone oxidoreductase subunit 5 (subunit L)/multisubunit Na+/H+ antiporter MnhA subunit
MTSCFILRTLSAEQGTSFGGKFLVRFLASGKGLDAGFTAHPAGVEAAEWQAISAPLSIAFGGSYFSRPLYLRLSKWNKMLIEWQNWMHQITQHNDPQQKLYSKARTRLTKRLCIQMLSMGLLCGRI